MSEPATELARREGDALSTIVGTGDTRAALEVLERNVRDVIEVCRARGFVTSFRQGNVSRDFYGFPAWQLLGMTYGVTPIVQSTEQVDGGYKARAVAQTRDGSIVGAAEAVCLRKESSKRNADDNTLLAMAQTRAQRNALRAAFGAALVLAGFDFADPDGPVTREQVKALHALEGEIGLTHEQGHREAGVDSYNDLTREEASLLLDRWNELRQAAGDSGESRASSAPAEQSEPGYADDVLGSDAGSGGSETTLAYGEGAAASRVNPPDPAPSEDAPASAVAWERATKAGLTSRKAVAIAKGLGYEVTAATDITGGQLAKVLARYKDRSGEE